MRPRSTPPAMCCGLAVLLLACAPLSAAGPGLPWCPDPGPDDEGFYACPCPACMAPCQFPAPPQGECKAPDGSLVETTFACCCCGGSDSSFRFYSSRLALDEAAGDTLLAWTVVPGAEIFDVVRGDLGTLRATAGSYVAATTACAGENQAATSLLVEMTPAPGDCAWFLVRGATGGSYDSAGGSQAASRDAAIAASGHDCAP